MPQRLEENILGYSRRLEIELTEAQQTIVDLEALVRKAAEHTNSMLKILEDVLKELKEKEVG